MTQRVSPDRAALARAAVPAVLAALLVSACGGAACDKPRRYDRETSRPRLEVPEDLDKPTPATPFQIPEVYASTSGPSDRPCTDYPPKIRQAQAPAASPEVAAEASGVPTGADLVAAIEGVRAVLEDWAEAWSNGDVAAYLGHYSAAFLPPGDMTVDEWQASRARRLAEGANVTVLPDTITVDVHDANTASAAFVQQFQTGTLLTQVLKNVLLTREDGVWRIRSERVVNML